MDRESLIDKLREGIEFEESVIPTLADFYASELAWTELPKEKVSELRNILETLINDSKKHRNSLDELLKKIEDDGADEY